ncbi:MAG: NCS2 family permease [Planctomycetota bacterium]|nr:NCS2 family permease [Planctomycetota bacterium]
MTFLTKVDRFFEISARNSNFAREIVGGVVTFMTMCYIVFVQPVILEKAGMDARAVFVATCVSSAFATLLMGLYAKYPIALAPAMGHNAFFTFVVCGTMRMSWQQALLANFIAGSIFVLLSFAGFRRAVMESVPESLKHAIAVGIGLFIALIGFQFGGIVVPSPATGVSLGEVTKPAVLVTVFGLAVMIVLSVKRVPGALLVGIVAATVLAALLDLIKYEGVVEMPPSIAPTFAKLFTVEKFDIFSWSVLSVVFIFLFLDLFDTVGTLIGVGEQGGFIKDGRMPRAERALFSDACGTVFGTIMGTSTITSYIESASGVMAGARTGLASIVTAVLFIAALFFSPLVRLVGADVGGLHPMVAGALIMVGVMMCKSIGKINWEEFAEAIPAFLTMVVIPFTYSITDGIAAGFISYTAIRFVTRRLNRKDAVVAVLAVLFVLYYMKVRYVGAGA